MAAAVLPPSKFKLEIQQNATCESLLSFLAYRQVDRTADALELLEIDDISEWPVTMSLSGRPVSPAGRIGGTRPKREEDTLDMVYITVQNIEPKITRDELFTYYTFVIGQAIYEHVQRNYRKNGKSKDRLRQNYSILQQLILMTEGDDDPMDSDSFRDTIQQVAEEQSHRFKLYRQRQLECKRSNSVSARSGELNKDARKAWFQREFGRFFQQHFRETSDSNDMVSLFDIIREFGNIIDKAGMLQVLYGKSARLDSENTIDRMAIDMDFITDRHRAEYADMNSSAFADLVRLVKIRKLPSESPATPQSAAVAAASSSPAISSSLSSSLSSSPAKRRRLNETLARLLAEADEDDSSSDDDSSSSSSSSSSDDDDDDDIVSMNTKAEEEDGGGNLQGLFTQIRELQFQKQEYQSELEEIRLQMKSCKDARDELVMSASIRESRLGQCNAAVLAYRDKLDRRTNEFRDLVQKYETLKSQHATNINARKLTIQNLTKISNENNSLSDALEQCKIYTKQLKLDLESRPPRVRPDDPRRRLQ